MVYIKFAPTTASGEAVIGLFQQLHAQGLTLLVVTHEERVSRALALYEEQGPHVMCAIDLDRFKLLNDTLGHDYGDLMLAEVAARYDERRAAVRLLEATGFWANWQ